MKYESFRVLDKIRIAHLRTLSTWRMFFGSAERTASTKTREIRSCLSEKNRIPMLGLLLSVHYYPVGFSRANNRTSIEWRWARHIESVTCHIQICKGEEKRHVLNRSLKAKTTISHFILCICITEIIWQTARKERERKNEEEERRRSRHYIGGCGGNGGHGLLEDIEPRRDCGYIVGGMLKNNGHEEQWLESIIYGGIGGGMGCLM